MPITEAAMSGIRDHGHRWKRRICLGQSPALLGRLNDAAADGEDVDDAEVERLALSIVESVRRACQDQDWPADIDLTQRADDLEGASDCGLDEVNYFMGELYDSFDYWRILVDRPTGAKLENMKG